MVEDHMILLCSQSEVNIEEPTQEDIYRVGTVAKVRQMLKLPNGTIRVLVEGVVRAEIIRLFAERRILRSSRSKNCRNRNDGSGDGCAHANSAKPI